MKALLFICSVFFSLLAFAQSSVGDIIWMQDRSTPIYIRPYVLIWSDEFDANHKDEDWFKVPPVGANPEGDSPSLSSKFDLALSRNVIVQNGVCSLKIKKETEYARGRGWDTSSTAVLDDGGPNLRYWEWTGSEIWTTRQWRYGYYEAKMKLAGEDGSWPAFWLYSPSASGEEIDIMEGWGEKAYEYSVNLHNCNNCKDWKDKPSNTFCSIFQSDPNCTRREDVGTAPVNLHTTWLKYGSTWSEHKIRMYANRDMKHWYASDDIPNMKIMANSMNMILGNRMSTGEVWSSEPTSSTSSNFDVLIEYVRVYDMLYCEWDRLLDHTINVFNESSHLTGRQITVDGTNNGNHHIYLKDKPTNRVPQGALTLIATEDIILKGQFSVTKGAKFHAKIVPCPAGYDWATGTGHPRLAAPKEEDLEELENFVIYPNPSVEHINFDGIRISQGEVRIVDYSGKIVYQANNQNLFIPLNISHFKSGIYQVIIISDDEYFKSTFVKN